MEEPRRRRRSETFAQDRFPQEQGVQHQEAPRQARVDMKEPQEPRRPQETTQPLLPFHVKATKEMYGHSCRNCINMRFRVHLKPKDVKYVMRGNDLITDRCRFCGRVGHIVSGVRISGKVKLLGKR